MLAGLPSTHAATADEIMARVAANQDAAQHARTNFVYRQHIAVRLRDTHAKLVREEITDYHVTPGDESTQKEISQFEGRYRSGGSLVSYDKPDERQNEGIRNELDGEMAHELREELTGDDDSKDGLASDLFPLTAKEQRHYRFTLKGEEKYHDTDVYRVSFEPAKGADGCAWKGQALISKTDFQPMMVTTKLAHGIPLMVRTVLGTSLQGLGFSVEYRKFDDGVWFPVTYGTEFRVRALFFYSRTITVAMTNSDFRRADVQSAVTFDSVK
jgi:hypothetical protein